VLVGQGESSPGTGIALEIGPKMGRKWVGRFCADPVHSGHGRPRPPSTPDLLGVTPPWRCRTPPPAASSEVAPPSPL
jgi:hypothetical protein